ncbi:uncharacterized protein LOC118187059 [Stegodyphus dumicola]|uniref:uncharacterized protein LOC118187059 n=1 Tax=Stegodyphus dumicola TaxID=202533 RepID=UPI0015B14B88|nr:uncharacterized protein LOC118187059 [Stegodyphus dumicola]
MFSKGDQRSRLKIEVARGKNATDCYRGLVETCGTNALPYRTVARWVQAFRSGRNETADLQRTGRRSEQIDILSGLLTIDRRWTVRELSLEVGLSHQTVWHNEDSRMQHHLRPAMRRKRPRLLHNNLPIILYGNARCHVANNVTLLLRRWQ